jgi:ERCC4-related helicase
MLPDISSLYESTDDTMDEIISETAEMAIESLKSKGMFELDADYLNDDFMKDLDSDIAILSELKEQWSIIPDAKDPKLNEFVKIIKAQLQKDSTRKIVVFSQFADTVEYLGRRLEEENLPVFAYTSERASEKNKEYIKANFDAGYPAKLCQ